MELLNRKISSCYKSFTSYMEKDTKGVEIGIYTISGIIFAVAYTKIRPITRFVKPSSIPRHFIKEKLHQNGVISKIEPNIGGPLIMVNHKPPVNIFFLSKKSLPVKLTGIEIDANGFSWLQTVVVDKRIKFIPLATTDDYAECQVCVISAFNYNKQLDLADALLGLGFAKLAPIPDLLKEDKLYLHYYKSLASAEKKARRNRVGLWLSTMPPPIWPVRMFNKMFHAAIISITPPGRRLPQLVR